MDTLNLIAVVSSLCDIDGVHPAWLLWLAIALGVLFLIMLLMNIFLCTAMSCSCARTEVSIGKPLTLTSYEHEILTNCKLYDDKSNIT